MISVAVMGHGTVGSGVAEILINHSERIKSSILDDLCVKYILDLRDFDNLPYSDKFIKDFNIILSDTDVKIVVETMGGTNPAYDFVKKCLLAGKSVVTSNKELVAAKGAELIKIASQNNASFLFEASVGGGIPILHPLINCLNANKINEITGILNGTTNFILNKMIVSNMDFNSALKLAQEKGFAEKNPAADIEGHDAARKICILATLAFGKHVYPEQVETQGITEITLDDVAYAENFGCVIKLIGNTKLLQNGKISATVRPTLVSKENMLSNVNGVFNAITVNGDMVGDVMFYGKGAGKEATASAVVADVIECAKYSSCKKYLSWVDGSDDYVIKPDEKCRLYVCAKAKDFDNLCDSFTSLFPNNDWNIKNKFSNELAFITEEDTQSILLCNINKLNADSIKIMHTLF